jgi:hypothetical protein
MWSEDSCWNKDDCTTTHRGYSQMILQQTGITMSVDHVRPWGRQNDKTQDEELSATEATSGPHGSKTTRPLEKGETCLYDTCNEHRLEKEKEQNHYMWSSDYCQEHNCAVIHYGYTRRQLHPGRREARILHRQDDTPPTYEQSLQKVKEINVIEAQPQQQGRDDGYHTRGRSPPALRRQDASLQQNPPEIPESVEDAVYQWRAYEPWNEMESNAPLGDIPEDDENVPSMEIEEEESQTTETSDNGEEEEQTSEYSDDEEPDHNEIYHLSVDGPQPVLDMVLCISQRYKKVFPCIAGKRRLHPQELDQLLGQLRSMFWKYRQVNFEYDTRHMIREMVPIGSTFQGNGAYMMPDGKVVSRQMRDRVKTLQQRYDEIMSIQSLYQENVLTLQEMRSKMSEHMPQWHIPPLALPGQLLPVQRNMILGHVKALTRGPVRVVGTQERVVFKPQDGPLSWEICLENADSPTYFSKNE